MEDKRQATALFRYSLIRELADPELSSQQRGARIRGLTATDHAFDGQRVEVSDVTLWRWLRAWRAGGFEALVPAVRRQPNRTPAELLEAAEALKREAPKRTAVQVARILAEAGRGPVSSRTIQRHFARLGLDVRPDGQPPRALGRFEADEFGELWTGDGMHGPMVAGAKAILFAFVDDWSRAVPGWRWGFGEDTVRLEAALRRGLESAGIPRACFVDNGSAYISAPFHRTLAVLGIRITHSTPGHPASRGKVERFFRTVREQFLVELEARGGAASLVQLDELFGPGWRASTTAPCTPRPAGPHWSGGWPAAAATAEPGRTPRGVPVERDPTCHQDPLGQPSRQPLRGRPRPGRRPRAAALRPLRPDRHRGPLPGPAHGPRHPPAHRPPHPPRGSSGGGATAQAFGHRLLGSGPRPHERRGALTHGHQVQPPRRPGRRQHLRH